MKFCVLACICFLVISCSTTKNTDYSNHSYFSDFINKDVLLIESQKLCEAEDNLNYRTYRKFKMIPEDGYCDFKVVGIVPAGTNIKIKKIMKNFVSFSIPSVYALGSVKLDNRIYEFEYLYGHYTIYRAPWENEETPSRRPAPGVDEKMWSEREKTNSNFN